MRDGFRAAALAYFAYGVVYWIGGVYLLWHGIGVEGGPARGRPLLSVWALAGLVLVFLIPFLLGRRHAWFERWILSRRDFARILALLLAFRAFKVAQVALREDGGSVPAPWDGVITFRAGALVFLAVTLTALAFVARAAWRAGPS